MATMVKNGLVITMDGARRVIDRGAIAVDKGRIVEVGPLREVEGEVKVDETIDAEGKIVMPGLICAHTHMYNTLTRGMPIEFPKDFHEFLFDLWYPLIEDKFTPEDMYASSLMACVEMIRTGTTCFADVMEAPFATPGGLLQAEKAVEEAGLRGILSFEVNERISEEKKNQALKENLDFVQHRQQQEGIIKGMLCTHTIFTCSPEMLKEVRALADKHRCGIHIHFEEGIYEAEYSKETYDKLPAEHYRDIGFLGPDLLASQCVYTTDREIQILRQFDVKVSHNPMSNWELGSTLAPAGEMLKQGLTVGLGTDGAYYDMFEVMRTAFLGHKGFNEDPALMPSETVLEMATINGAKALMWEKEVGSLEKGKAADIIILDTDRITTPLIPQNAGWHVVNNLKGNDVNTVIVNGRILMKNKQILTVDIDQALYRCREAAKNLWIEDGFIKP